jgi:PST family polysaccharide transporter
MFALFVPALVYSGRPLGIGTRDVLQAVGPQTVAGLAAVAVGFGVQLEYLGELSQFTRIFASSVICLVTYLAIVVGIFRVTGPLQLAFSLLRDVRAIRSPAST